MYDGNAVSDWSVKDEIVTDGNAPRICSQMSFLAADACNAANRELLLVATISWSAADGWARAM
jgi:hypothetical protein